MNCILTAGRDYGIIMPDRKGNRPMLVPGEVPFGPGPGPGPAGLHQRG